MNYIKNSCESFSRGEFPAAYPSFADDIRWKIAGDRLVSGKEDVIAFCNKMTGEMDGAKLTNTSVLHTDGQSVIEGSCSYINSSNEPSLVEYCDIYLHENGLIKAITSYCISSVAKPVTI